MATKTSNAFNNFFYQQQQQQQQQPQSQQQSSKSNNNMNQPINDLHLKMSKKIAQLTKVIYSLNSKNDESENMLAIMRSQFEDEKDQFMVEMNQKLSVFKRDYEARNDQSSRIAKLEASIAEYEKQKQKAIEDVKTIRIEALDNEERLIVDHKQEIIDLNKTLEDIKTDFEKQRLNFETTCNKYEKEKQFLIEDLKSKHRLELEKLRTNINSTNSQLQQKFDEEKKLNDAAHQQDMIKLRAQLEVAIENLNKQKQDHDDNITKLKSFHSNELDALKKNATNEYLILIDNLKNEIETLKSQKNSSDKDLNQKYNQKMNELLDREEEIESLKLEIKNLQSNLEAWDSELVELRQKVIFLFHV
jgi:hypothetical protein